MEVMTEVNEVDGFDDVLEAKMFERIVKDYDGDLDEKENTCCFQGEAVATLKDGSVYDGTYKQGLFEGKGSFTWSDGVVYTGEFKNGNAEGTGEYSWTDGSRYEGNVNYFKRQGEGVFSCSSGQAYEGTWKNGLRDGKGTQYYNDAKTVSFKGSWRKGLRHGFGTMTYISGNVYEGEWVEDKKSGHGVMTWSDRQELYIGMWENDLANGEGEHIWTETPQKSFQRQTCNLYRGSFKDGKRHGFGTFFYSNGSQYTGQWFNNCKHGLGCFVHADGKIHVGSFQEDDLIMLNKESKETEAVTTQYKLNVAELLGLLPAIEKAPSFQRHTMDMERLILRYNAAIRHVIQKLSNQSASLYSIQCQIDRKQNKRKMHPTMQPPPEWSAIDNLFYNRRDIHSKFFTVRMHELCQFARECDIIGPKMTSYDICKCVKEMHTEHNNVANKKLRQFISEVTEIREDARRMEEYAQNLSEQAQSQAQSVLSSEKSVRSIRSEQSSLVRPPTPPKTVDPDLIRAVEGVDTNDVPHLRLSSLLDSSFESDLYTDMRYPLRSREFVEAFVRIVAESCARKNIGGVSGGGLFDNVYRMLAETVEPLSSGARTVPVFVSALYSEAVQTVLYENEGPLRSLWDQVLDIAVARGGNVSAESNFSSLQYQDSQANRMACPESECRPRLRHIVRVFMALKGTAIVEEGCTVMQLLEVLNKKGPSGDLSCLDLEVCFDDFVELFCRLAVSDLWTYGLEEEVAKDQQPELDEELPKNVTSTSIIESALVKRLSAWLLLI